MNIKYFNILPQNKYEYVLRQYIQILACFGSTLHTSGIFFRTSWKDFQVPLDFHCISPNFWKSNYKEKHYYINSNQRLLLFYKFAEINLTPNNLLSARNFVIQGNITAYETIDFLNISDSKNQILNSEWFMSDFEIPFTVKRLEWNTKFHKVLFCVGVNK